MITIVESGAGNLGSIRNMLRKLGVDSETTRDPAAVRRATKLILPGVGAFPRAIRFLREHDLVAALDEAVLERRTPILGVCLGMQLFSEGSEEGDCEGLGWLDARTVRFDFEDSSSLKVPHMGWNEVKPSNGHPVLAGLDEPRFYFAHSYHLACRNQRLVAATCWHGFDFCAVTQSSNIVGTQFHPEKSHRFGLTLLQNFASWQP